MIVKILLAMINEGQILQFNAGLTLLLVCPDVLELPSSGSWIDVKLLEQATALCSRFEDILVTMSPLTKYLMSCVFMKYQCYRLNYKFDQWKNFQFR